MSEADRIYRERARLEQKAQQERTELAEKRSLARLEELRQRISDEREPVLALLKAQSYPGGSLIPVWRKPAMRKAKTESVAAWPLHYQTEPWKDVEQS